MKSVWFDLLNLHQPRTPLPDGTTEETILAFLRSVRLAGFNAQEFQDYMDRDWRRFMFTLDLCKDVSGQGLEIGSSPYFTTALFQEFSPITITPSNWEPSTETRRTHHVSWIPPGQSAAVDHPLDHDLFNVEEGLLPYADSSFDVVFFCEVIEHLTHDPLHALAEIHRILKPGGRLILTTPNAANLRNILRMIQGRNTADRFSAYGPFGRHNREYTVKEMSDLLDFAGFDIVKSFTANVLFRKYSHMLFNTLGVMLISLASLKRGKALGQYIFISATKSKTASAGRPDWLYRSYDA